MLPFAFSLAMQRRHFLQFATLLSFFASWGRSRPTETGSLHTPLPPEPWQGGMAALARWRRAPRHPILASEHDLLRELAAAVRTNRPVTVHYQGGRSPGLERRVSPGMLYRVDGFPGAYLSGYCHVRGAERTFLVERMVFPGTPLG